MINPVMHLPAFYFDPNMHLPGFYFNPMIAFRNPALQRGCNAAWQYHTLISGMF